MTISIHPEKRALAALVLAVTTLAACHSPQKAAVAATQTGNKPPLPHMWISDSVGRADEKNFFFFDSVLSRKINGSETDSIFYPLPEFRGLIETCGTLPGITYFDIYPVVPTSTGKLSLLFVPKDAHSNPLAWFMLPENGKAFDRLADSVPPLQAASWAANYDSTVVKWLNPWLDPADSYNYLGCDSTNPDSLSNTLHVAHFYTDFVELDSEVNYQLNINNVNFSGFKAFFSCMPIASKAKSGAFANRIFPILEFTVDDAQGQHQVFPMDTTGTGRLYQGPDKMFGINPCMFRDHFSGDNGQMCPPTCVP